MQTPYRYSVLRYVHDVRTQEFLNVGVLFQSMEARMLTFRGIERTGRLSGAFPGVDTQCVLKSLAEMAERFNCLAGRSRSLEEVRYAVLPNDDSAFQWSPLSGGISEDLGKTLESVFYRHVGRYERKTNKRVRHDADVWNTIRSELERRHLLDRLRSAKISTPLRSYQFQHTWQNHHLHALKPISLDGQSGDEIADKAAHMAGTMRDLLRSTGRFQVHLVVGKPQQMELRGSFQSARELLQEAANGTRTVVHDESEAPQLAERIARDIAEHDRHVA